MKICFEIAGGSSYRGFELPGVDCRPKGDHISWSATPYQETTVIVLETHCASLAHEGIVLWMGFLIRTEKSSPLWYKSLQRWRSKNTDKQKVNHFDLISHEALGDRLALACVPPPKPQRDSGCSAYRKWSLSRIEPQESLLRRGPITSFFEREFIACVAGGISVSVLY